METVEALNEIDFGDWTGLDFTELEGDPEWKAWNACRSQATAPNGERMAAAQSRAFDHLYKMGNQYPGQTIAMVTHCDIIRALIAAVLDLSLDKILRFDIGPASISRIAIGDWGARVLTLNEGVE